MIFTLNDMVLLGIMLLIGLLTGLMISGRGKYKRLWRDERRAYDDLRKDRDARIAEANARIAALEQNRVSVSDGSQTATSAVASDRDDLTRIRTISSQDEVVLNEAGYHRFAQIGALNGEQQALLETRLGRQPGLIARDEWVEQARLLDAGDTQGHARRFERRKTAV